MKPKSVEELAEILAVMYQQISSLKFEIRGLARASGTSSINLWEDMCQFHGKEHLCPRFKGSIRDQDSQLDLFCQLCTKVDKVNE